MKETAIKAAKFAGKLLMDNLGKQTIIGSQYGTELCPVTKEDEDAELIIVEILKNEFPDHQFLGEELGESNTVSDYKWIIDPIDGTNNYLDGRDTFSVSIGLEYKSEIILGVVYLPKRDELFVAEKGKGATLNNQAITVSDKFDLIDTIITYSTMPGSEGETENLDNQIIESIPKVKFFGYKDKKDIDPIFGRGSMAAEFCYLACGRINGLIRLKQKPWDVAAGSLIAQEAGANMLNLKGEKCSIYEGNFIAANKLLLEKLMKIIFLN
jgi:myo-inositol-1(or 4)-monophosphatase